MPGERRKLESGLKKQSAQMKMTSADSHRAEIFFRLPWSLKACLISESGMVSKVASACEASRQEAITPKKNAPLGDVQGRCTTLEARINYVDNHALSPCRKPQPRQKSLTKRLSQTRNLRFLCLALEHFFFKRYRLFNHCCISLLFLFANFQSQS